MGEAWRGRCVSPSILTGRRAASSPVNRYHIRGAHPCMPHGSTTLVPSVFRTSGISDRNRELPPDEESFLHSSDTGILHRHPLRDPRGDHQLEIRIFPSLSRRLRHGRPTLFGFVLAFQFNPFRLFAGNSSGDPRRPGMRTCLAGEGVDSLRRSRHLPLPSHTSTLHARTPGVARLIPLFPVPPGELSEKLSRPRLTPVGPSKLPLLPWGTKSTDHQEAACGSSGRGRQDNGLFHRPAKCRLARLL